MKFGILVLLSATVAVLGLGGVVLAQPVASLSQDARAAVKGDNEFAFHLYAQLRQKEGNLFFSPYSISSALAMTYAGARGETGDQMARTLHFTLPVNQFHPAFGELVHVLNARDPKRGYKLNVANALWGQKGFNFLPDFLKVTQDQYEAGLKELDFKQNPEQARQAINSWVEEATQQKIKDLIQSGVLNNGTRLVLTNAIYFKAAWSKEFSKEATHEESFSSGPDTKTKVSMMHQKQDMSYGEDETLQVVAVPYEKHDLSLVILLPRKEAGLPELEKSLTEERVAQLLAKMNRAQVDLKLPKFKMTAEFQLKEVLSQMGMPLAFTNAADFSGMTTQAKLKIDKVIHKAYVDVNEKGTEAAAATAVIVMKTSAVFNQRRANFHANHPFVFLIRENRTGSILFMGRVVNPRS